MIPVALPAEPMVQLSLSSGSDKNIPKVSLLSMRSSSVIEIVSVALVCPAGNVTVYGPES